MSSSLPLTTDHVASPRRLNVMCIDDNALDLKLNLRVLGRAGVFEYVETCTGGEEALCYFRAGHNPPIDIIFLDVNMPLMNGFEFLEAATAEFGEGFARSVVVMLTTSLNPKDRERAEEFAIVRDFLSKPLSVEQALLVADKVNDLLES